ncbi:MAG: DapH/DapD/GlmU-related protein [Syntrophobacteraceae bacterium]|jgi:maltose O-acetyltransferase
MSFGRFVIKHLVSLLPPTRVYALKAHLWRLAGVRVSTSARIVSTVSFYTNGNIFIGDRTFIGEETTLVSGDADILIGDDVDIAPRVLIVGGSHEIDMIGPRSAGTEVSRRIEVQNGVWIGASSTVLGGVTIGKKAVIAAGSVVNQDVPPFSMVAGVPARVVKVWDETSGKWLAKNK